MAVQPLKLIGGLLLIILLITLIVPLTYLNISVEPKNIPKIEEFSDMITLTNTTNNITNIYEAITPHNSLIRNIAVRIATQSCPSNDKTCQTKAIYYFVRDNIKYVNDPKTEYYELPQETLYSRGADCDGMMILLASLEEAIGVDTRLVFIPNHVYGEVLINKNWWSKDKHWVPVDPTCKECEFGETPLSTTIRT